MTKKIGLFGYGVVGQGFLKALEGNPHLDVELFKICIKDITKPRDLSQEYFTDDPNEILTAPEVDLIIELTDDAEAAFHIVESALKQNKPVISANKKMIADNLTIVKEWHEQYAAPFLYEAAVAGSIPIIHNLEQYFSNQKISLVRGILNGSTNYILTLMREQNISFDEALKNAQEKGFAESDPSLDISGKDALSKLLILGYHAFGLIIDPESVRVESITNMEDHFYDLAAQQGLKIKSIASIYESKGKYRFKVQPELVGPEDELFGIENEYNAVVVEGDLSGKQVYVGRGAGSLPTASAIINDLSLLLDGFRYQKGKNRTLLRKSA